MDRLKALVKSYIPRSRKAISPEYYCKNTLPGLPTELLLQICDLLTLVDLVCFCLCNHRLHTISWRYHRLPSLRKDKLSIFARLERDLPEYLLAIFATFFIGIMDQRVSGLMDWSKAELADFPVLGKGMNRRKSGLGAHQLI